MRFQFPPWRLLLLGLSTAILDNCRSIHLPTTNTIIELWPLCFVALVPILVAQDKAPLTVLIVFPITAMIRCSIQGFPLIIGLCLGIVIAALWSLLVLIDKLVFTQPNTKSEPLRRSILWTAMWYGLSAPLGTFELLCSPLYVAPALLQPISIFGVFGLELMVMYANASIAAFVSSKNYKYITRMAFDLSFWVVVSFLLFTINHNVGREPITVATITPGALLPNACGGRSEIIHVGGRLPCNGSVDRMLNLTELVAVEGRAKIVVWPEAWLSGFSDQSSLQLFIDKQISPVVKRLGIFLTLGATVYPQQNLAITINNIGQIISMYGKQYPFWVAGEMSSAKYGYPLFDIPASMGSIRPDVSVSGNIGTAGTLICYDMDFASTARELASLGASIILNPSNDWSAMRNHYGISVMRAVENNIPIVKADGAWDSAIVDGKGRVVAQFQSTEPLEKALVGEVQLGGSMTIYTIIGDLLPILCCSYVIMVILLSLRGLAKRAVSAVEAWHSRRRLTLYAPILDQERGDGGGTA